MTDLNTGTLSQLGNSTFVSGLSSGLNTSALIQLAYQQKVQKADRIDVQIQTNLNKMDAYSTLSGLSGTLQSAMGRLKSVVGFTSDPNVYSQRTATYSAADGSDPSNYLDIALDTDASLANYTVQVTQRATAQKVQSTTLVADKTAALGYTGSFDLSLDGGAGVTINVTAGMSLENVAAQINASKESSGVQASVLKVADGDFRLVMTATQTNKEITVGNVVGDDVMLNLGVTDGLGGFQNELQGFQPAMMRIDGVDITRDSNTIDDAIDGLIFTIKGENPGVDVNIDVETDSSSVRGAIEDFIAAYNELREFVLQNQQVNADGSLPESAVLFGDSLLKNLSSQMGFIIGANYTTQSGIETLREAGITLDSSNRLVITDSAQLDNLILNDFDTIRDLFETDYTASSTELGLIRNNSNNADMNFVLDITTDGAGNITGVSVGGDNTLFNVSGDLITGAAGSIYQGLTFAYIGLNSDSVTVDLRQGFADRMHNTLKRFTDLPSGELSSEILRLERVNTDLDFEADEIRARAADFREKEIERYAKLEAQMQAAKILIAQLKAILGTNDDDR